MTDRKTAIRRITDSELLELPFGSKIKVVWYNSPHHSKNSEYCGVIFGNKIGYEDGFVDSVRTIAECMFNDWCMVYILDEKNLSNINLSVTIRNDNVAHEMYCKGIDDFVHKVKEHHYVLSDVINSTDYGMFTIGIEQIAEELKAGGMK